MLVRSSKHPCGTAVVLGPGLSPKLHCCAPGRTVYHNIMLASCLTRSLNMYIVCKCVTGYLVPPSGIVSFLFLGGACSSFCSLGWAVMACRLLLAIWLVLAMWAGLIGSVWLATVVVLEAYDF